MLNIILKFTENVYKKVEFNVSLEILDIEIHNFKIRGAFQLGMNLFS